MSVIISATRERFLLAIAAEIVPERIEEIHFFQPIRQGGIESGVAVVAATLPPPVLDTAVEPEVELGEPVSEPDADEAADTGPARRYTVSSAQYRLVLKGVDRGRWETSVVEEADAPLITIESVVRGVQRRSGDEEAPERMDGESVREILRRVAESSPSRAAIPAARR